MPSKPHREALKLTRHDDRCWRKDVGGKRFYFADDERAASLEAEAITALWRQLKAKGHQAWPTGQPDRTAIRRALGLEADDRPEIAAAVAAALGQSMPTVPAPKVAAEQTVAVGGLTLRQAAELFLAAKAQEPISDRTKDDARVRLSIALDKLGKDNALHSIGSTELQAFSSNVQSNNSKTYAKHLLQSAKAFFVWASDHDQIEWSKPKGFDALMLLKKKEATTQQQREELAEKVWADRDERHFTIDELKAIYAKADKRMRAWILLALNTAMNPIDICRLKNNQIKRNGNVKIQTIRGKTLVPCQYVLWEETAKALDAVRTEGAESYTFVSNTKMPLMNKGLQDKYFAYAWAKLRKDAGVPDAPDFKHLRHTSGNEIKKISSEEISLIHKAQTPKEGIDAVYTAPNWEKHAKAVAKLRNAFKEIWS